jgi:hypothetical protein
MALGDIISSATDAIGLTNVKGKKRRMIMQKVRYKILLPNQDKHIAKFWNQ